MVMMASSPSKKASKWKKRAIPSLKHIHDEKEWSPMNLFLRLSLFPLFLFLQNFLTAQEPMRTWTSSDGRAHLEARFIEQVGSNVKIKNEAGREFTLPDYPLLTGGSRIISGKSKHCPFSRNLPSHTKMT